MHVCEVCASVGSLSRSNETTSSYFPLSEGVFDCQFPSGEVVAESVRTDTLDIVTLGDACHHLARRRPAGIPQLALDAVAGEIRGTVGRGRPPRDREGRWPAWITPATIPNPVSTGRESPGNGNQRSATGPRAVGQSTWGELPRASKLK